MSVGLIVVIVLLAWALGPAVLKWAGGFFAITTLVLWAFPLGTHTPGVALLVTGLGGALMWCVGMSWQDGRETGRGPLVWDLLVERIPALRERRQRRWRLYAHDWGETGPPTRFETEYPQPRRTDQSRRGGRGRWSARGGRRADAPPSTSSRYGRPGRSSDGSEGEDECAPGSMVIDGVAHDLHATPEEDRASIRRSLRDDVDRTLEQARDHLEPIVYGLFVNTGVGWLERLNTARRTRRKDLAAIDGGADVFHDRRVLFAVIAYHWPLIGHAFMRDPSRAGRELCAIANRYAHEGPRESDPAAARRAFAEICAALRRESVASVSWLFKPSR